MCNGKQLIIVCQLMEFVIDSCCFVIVDIGIDFVEDECCVFGLFFVMQCDLQCEKDVGEFVVVGDLSQWM